MGARTKVLVFPCGSENASEIYQALRYSLHVDLVGASSIEDHGRFRFPHYVGGLPRIGDADFDAAFSTLVAALAIEVVFATHDSVLEYLAPRASAMNFHLVNGDPRTASITRTKSATYDLFSDCAWIPRTFKSPDDVDAWPIIIKPDRGQGGQQVALASGLEEARFLARSIADPVLVEYLPGPEITVDCFSDRLHRVKWIGPRTRERVKAGITMRSRALPLTPEIEGIAATIAERLTLRGPWFFQLKLDRNKAWKLLEVSGRVAGAMSVTRARGINLPLMAIHDYLGRDVVAEPIGHVALVERNIATRAELSFRYDSVFVDLDDTLIVNEFANPLALAFLYQSVRDGKRIILITRHASDVLQTLARARISPTLFDEIIKLGPTDSKADFVSPSSIFVDNHFPERAEVSRRLGIPVFDVDGLEFLVR